MMLSGNSAGIIKRIQKRGNCDKRLRDPYRIVNMGNQVNGSQKKGLVRRKGIHDRNFLSGLVPGKGFHAGFLKGIRGGRGAGRYVS